MVVGTKFSITLKSTGRPPENAVTSWFGYFLISVAIAVVFVSVRAVRVAKLERSWPLVPGLIVRCDVTHLSIYPRANIQYSYRFNGQPFVGQKIRSLFVYTNWSGPAEELARKYPKGATCCVAVDPVDPSNSVLEPGGDKRFLPLIVLCASFTLFVGISIVVSAW
jgi:hypothetical protein